MEAKKSNLDEHWSFDSELFMLDIRHIYDIIDYNSGDCGATRNVDYLRSIGAIVSENQICYAYGSIRYRLEIFIKLSKMINLDDNVKFALCGGSIVSVITSNTVLDFDFFPILKHEDIVKLSLEDPNILEQFMCDVYERPIESIGGASFVRVDDGPQSTNYKMTYVEADCCNRISKDRTHNVQLVRRLFTTLPEILYSFDISACQFAIMDGIIYCTGAALSTLVNKTICCDVSASSYNYSKRLIKYHRRSFHILPYKMSMYTPVDKKLIESHVNFASVLSGRLFGGKTHDIEQDELEKIRARLMMLDKISQLETEWDFGTLASILSSSADHNIEMMDKLFVSIIMTCCDRFMKFSCYDFIYNYIMYNIDMSHNADPSYVYYEEGNLIKSQIYPRFILDGCVRHNEILGEVNMYESKQAEWIGPNGVMYSGHMKSAASK